MVRAIISVSWQSSAQTFASSASAAIPSMPSQLQGVRAAPPENVVLATEALAHALGWDEPYNENEWGIVEGEGTI